MRADEQSEVTSNLIAAESAVAALPMTLVDPTGQTYLAPYDPKVLAFIDEDMEIRNPYFSPCGRFLVDPVKAYGFVETHTGGGCMALDLPHGDGTLRLVQDGILSAIRMTGRAAQFSSCHPQVKMLLIVISLMCPCMKVGMKMCSFCRITLWDQLHPQQHRSNA